MRDPVRGVLVSVCDEGRVRVSVLVCVSCLH